MDESIRVELPLFKQSKLLSTHKTIGDLRAAFKELKIVKYIFLDPKDSMLKGRNPDNDLPLVDESYITINGDIDRIIEFTEEAKLQT